MWGIWTMLSTWRWELRMVALHGWMLARMSPCDLVAFLAGAGRVVRDCASARVCLCGMDLVHLWAIAFLKWPKCVDIWASVVAAGTPGVSAGTPISLSTWYATQAVELARQCDLEEMTWMHEQISTGNQNVLFGPVVWLAKLGMNPDAQPHKRLKTELDPSNTQVLALGKARKSYHVCPNSAVWATLVAHADSFDKANPEGLGLPQTLEDLQAFVDTVDQFLQGFPEVFGYSEARARKRKKVSSEEHSKYCRKHILRKILIWVHSKTSELPFWEHVSVQLLQKMSADKNDYLADLDAGLTWKQLRELFGISPLMISCWACLFTGVKTDAHKEVFSEASVRLWNTAQQLSEEHDGVEPNMRSLAIAVLERKSRANRK